MKTKKTLMTFDGIRDFIGEDLKKIEKLISRNFQSDVLLIPTIANYLIGAGGKKFRPMLLVLSSKLSGYSNGDRHILNSCIVELIHVATLLHDDVVDEALIRRGNPSVNKKWGNEASVLVGDYLFSKSLSLLALGDDSRITQSISFASQELAEGEIIGLVTKGNFDITEEEYMDIIYKKTASLISVSCKIGAILGNISPDKEKALTNFGLKIGIAYQLIDDVLDYTGDQEKLGKTIGLDFQRKKMTLPLIILFQKVSAEEKIKIQNLIFSCNNYTSNLKTLVEMMERHNTIEYAIEKAKNYVEEAKKEMEIFDDSPYLVAIFSLADHIIARKN
jgi:octaprenyl-diphosphate synthase